jgi:hypothetical protein
MSTPVISTMPTAARGADIPDELKVKLFRAARGSLYRNDIDPCALPAIGSRNTTLN